MLERMVASVTTSRGGESHDNVFELAAEFPEHDRHWLGRDKFRRIGGIGPDGITKD